MTIFKSALKLIGLDQREASLFLGVSLQSVKYWSAGTRNCPDKHWVKLAALYDDIQNERDLPFDSCREVLGARNLLGEISRPCNDHDA